MENASAHYQESPEPRKIGDILSQGVVGREDSSRTDSVRATDLQSEVEGLRTEVADTVDALAAGHDLDTQYVTNLQGAHLGAIADQSQNQTG